MRSVVGLAAVTVSFFVACGSDSGPEPGSGTGATGGAVADGSVGGVTGTGATWPGGGTSGASGSGGASGAGATGGTGAAGASGSGGSTATGGAAGGGGCGAGGPVQCGTGGPCEFPQGAPESDFFAFACTYQDTDPAVDSAVNSVMASLTGCGVGSDCPITVVAGTTTDEICQNWFKAVTAQLRAQGFCAGQHEVNYTDEIAVSNTCCEGKWYGYHICNYGGAKVVWNPGARRGWWRITPSHCP